jgi:hypothetical protein
LCHDLLLDDKLFEVLAAKDARIAAGVKAAGCRECGGRLDRANYPRKPRGGPKGTGWDQVDRRLSFCCCRDGCRRRATPPSLVFLGRRVYLGIVILAETLMMAAAAAARAGPPGTPRRTVRRWQTWFRVLRESPWLESIRGQVWPPLEPDESLPEALVNRLCRGAGSKVMALIAMLRLLLPLTTRSVAV